MTIYRDWKYPTSKELLEFFKNSESINVIKNK